MAINLGYINDRNKKQQQELYNQHYNNVGGLNLRRKSSLDEERRRREEEERLRKQQEEQNSFFKSGDSNFGVGMAASSGDFLLDIGQGFFRTLEGVADFLQYSASDSQKMESKALESIFGKNAVSDFYGGMSDFFKENAKFDSTGSLFGTNENAQDTLFGNEWRQNIDQASYLGGMGDQIGEGIGNIGAMAALSVVGGSALGATGIGVTEAGTLTTGGKLLLSGGNSYISAYGNARSEAYKNGASDDEANRYAMINGLAEAVSEQFFDSMPGISSAGFAEKIGIKDFLANKIKSGIGSNTAKVFLKLVGGFEEGAEEMISNALVAVGQDIMHSLDENYTYGMDNLTGNVVEDFKNNFVSEDSLKSFISAGFTSVLLGAGGDILTNAQTNQVINAFAKDNNMSFKEAKALLSGENLNQAQQQVQREDNGNISNQVELEDAAKQRIINYMKANQGKGIESRIEALVQNEAQKKGIEYTPQELKQEADKIRAELIDQTNSPDRYMSFVQTDKETNNELAESFRKAGVNNSKQAHEMYNFVSKLQESNKNLKYEVVNNKILKEMGQDVEGATINGFNQNGTIYINMDAKNPYQAVAYHEIAHSIKDTSPELYNELKNLVFELKGKEGLEQYRKLYNVNDNELASDLTENVEDEYINDQLGEILSDDNFINKIDNRNIIQKLIDEIKRVVKYMTSSKDQKALMKTQQKLEQIYKQGFSEAESKEGTAFSLSKQKLEQDFKELTGDSILVADAKLGNYAFQQMQGREAQAPYNEEAMKLYNDIKNSRKTSSHLYHSTPASRIQSIVQNGLVVGSEQNQEGISSADKLYLSANEELADSFTGDDSVMLRISPSAKLENLDNDLLGGEGSYTITNNIEPKYLQVKEDGKWVNLLKSKYAKEQPRYSLSVQEANAQTNNYGQPLTEGQKEYFKDSKAVNEDGELIEVFHTMTDRGTQFNEFNPVGTLGYRFGDQVVTYYTDNQAMSTSYAGGDQVRKAYSKPLETIDDVKEYIDFINKETNDTLKVNGITNNYEIVEEDGKYVLTQKPQGKEFLEYANLSDEGKVALDRVRNNDNLHKVFLSSDNPAQEVVKQLRAWYDTRQYDGYPELAEILEMYDRETSKLIASQNKYSGQSIIRTAFKTDLEEYLFGTRHIGDEQFLDTYRRNLYKTYESEQDLIDNIQKNFESKYQYGGYVNITNPYVINTYGENWNSVVTERDVAKSEEYNNLVDTIEKKTALTQLAEESRAKHFDYTDGVNGLDYTRYKNIWEKVTNRDLRDVIENTSMFGGDYNSWIEAGKKNAELFGEQYVQDVPNGNELLSNYVKDLNTTEESIIKDMTIEDFVSKYSKVYENEMNYGDVESYFKKHYKEITGKPLENIDTKKFYDMAYRNFDYEVVDNVINKRLTTNDIVNKIIESNKSGETNYDGIIMKDVYDYGSNVEGFKTTGNLYVTFNSEQFKLAGNENPTSNPDIRYSLSVEQANTGTDNTGRELSNEQKEYFKNSKVTDENGNLIEVFHTTTEYTHQFNEFNPVGTPLYRYGNTAVNFFTDSQDMSSSYGYNMLSPDTTRIESMEDLSKQLGDRYRVEENNGKYELFDSNDEKQLDSYKDLMKIFNQEEQDILNKTFNKSRSEVRELLNNDEEQFDFYDKTRTKFLNMLSHYNKFKGLDLTGTNMTIDKIVDNYLRNEKIEPITTFNSQEDLFKNAIKYVSPYEHYQYNGYVNITNPYIVDAKGTNWNKIQVENIDELKQQIKDKWDVPERQLDKLEGDTLKELNKDLTKLGYQIRPDDLGDLGIFTKDSQLAIDVINVNDVMQEIREDLDSDLKTPISTNDIVFQALAENEAGANYDGVIIQNVIDYGENSRNPDIPNNVYVTFNSNQFKAADNLNPTQDSDIRYSLARDEQQSQNSLLKVIKSYDDYLKTLPSYQRLQERQEGTPLSNYTDESHGILTKEDYKNKKIELFDKQIEKADNKMEEQAKRFARENLELTRKAREQLQTIIDKYKGQSRESIFNSDAKEEIREFVRNNSRQEFVEEIIDEETRDLQRAIRNTELVISKENGGEFADGITAFKKNNPGIKIKYGNQNIDSVYQELQEQFPGMLETDVNDKDIPFILADVLKKSYRHFDNSNVQVFELNDSEIDNIANKIYKGLTNNAISDEQLESLTKEISQKVEDKYARAMATEKYREIARNTIDITDIKDKKRGIQYKVNTMKRNLRDIMSKEQAQLWYDTYFKPITIHNAQSEIDKQDYVERIQKYNLNNAESTYTQMLGELKYNPETNLTSDQVNTYAETHNVDKQKCTEAVEEFRNIYDELIGRVNEALKANGYKEIDYRKGYFPHFIEDKPSSIIGKFADKFGWNIQKGTLPTDIAGLTDGFKPGKAWTSFSQQRTGDNTDYNALKGMDNYLRGAMDLIYHTEDIQKLRALENEIRYQYSSDGVKTQIDEIYANQELSAEEKAQQIALLTDNLRDNPLGNLVTELRDYTNGLANKKSILDRGMEQALGRDWYSIMNNINGRVSANMVGANLSSAMTNFIPITQAWSQVSTKNLMRGMYESIKNTLKNDGFDQNSVYLTNRTQQADTLYKTTLDKVNQKLGLLFEGIDSFTSNTIVRAKYYENLDKGMSEQSAIENADEFAKDVMAGRSKGDQPTIFNTKNPLYKMFTAFQLEVNNQYGYMFKDIPADLGDEGKDKLAMAFMKMFIGAWLYNMITEKITGRKAAFSPIDMAVDEYKIATSDMDLPTKVQNIAKDVAQETPFLGGIMGGGRLPLQSAIPYENPLDMVTKTFENIGTSLGDDESKKKTAINSLKKEWLKPVYYVALPFAGGQIKKSVEGMAMYDENLPVAGSYTDAGKLRFEADTSPQGRLQALLFGQYASENAREYFDKGYTPLTEKQINEALDANLPMTEYREIKKGLSKQEGTENKVDYIYNLPISDEQKNVLVNNTLNRKEDIDLTNYGDYGSLEEFDYATKNPTKYKTITQITDYDTYQTYKEDLAAIKDKYSTTDERKQAVFNYINNLNLNMYQKLMLQKMAGGYSIKNYKSYVQSYINSLDLTKEEKEVIDNELFG